MSTENENGAAAQNFSDAVVHEPNCTDHSILHCPDCGAGNRTASLTHEDSCPVLRSSRATSRTDRIYFEKHPAETARVRPIGRGEGIDLGLSQGIPTNFVAVGDVTVKRLAPGVRALHYSDIRFVSKWK